MKIVLVPMLVIKDFPAKGDVLTDSDCIPALDWIERAWHLPGGLVLVKLTFLQKIYNNCGIL